MLSDYNIVRIHQMHAAGEPLYRIAEAVGVNRNSVSDHLAFRVAYSAKVCRSLPYKPHGLPNRFPIALRNVGPLLPGWPSRDVIDQLVSRGVIETIVGSPADGGRDNVRCCTLVQVAEAAQRMLPLGAWISYATCRERLGFAPKVAFRRGWAKLADVFAEHPDLSLPWTVTHRALHALNLTGVAGICFRAHQCW